MNRPERIYHASQTQLSVARLFGGCKFNGADYHYDAENDELVRMDIWKAHIASDKKAAAKAAKAAKAERDKWMKVQQSFVDFA